MCAGCVQGGRGYKQPLSLGLGKGRDQSVLPGSALGAARSGGSLNLGKCWPSEKQGKSHFQKDGKTPDTLIPGTEINLIWNKCNSVYPRITSPGSCSNTMFKLPYKTPFAQDKWRPLIRGVRYSHQGSWGAQCLVKYPPRAPKAGLAMDLGWVCAHPSGRDIIYKWLIYSEACETTATLAPLIGVDFVLLLLKQRSQHFVQRRAKNSEIGVIYFWPSRGHWIQKGHGFRGGKCAFSGTPVKHCTKVLIVY